VALRLFLPESWTSDRARLKRAGVPAEHQAARTKPEIALAEIDRMIAAGVHFGCALADAGYGLSAPFRQGLTARGLAWAVGIPRHLEGRSWQGLHRRALMTMIAYAFLQHRRLTQARRGKKNRRTATSANLARRASRHRQRHYATTAAMPALSNMAPRHAA